MTHSAYHTPVMLEESLQALAPRPAGAYADLTFGGGGHSRALLQQLGPEGQLWAFDKDAEAAPNAETLGDERLTFIAADFRYMGHFLRYHQAPLLDGILADLGVSSHQIDAPERGFAIRKEGPLDMRMNPQTPTTAADLLNDTAEEDMVALMSRYGDIKNARTLVRELVKFRTRQPFQSTADLREAAWKAAPRGKEYKYLAQVFQGLRIALNDEMAGLKEMLQQAPDWLKPGGRLVVLTYHSLEDRPVKRFMASGNFRGTPEKDFYGRPQRPLEPLKGMPLQSGSEEQAQNPRARSAKLRAAQKTE